VASPLAEDGNPEAGIPEAGDPRWPSDCRHQPSAV
jgi:hypothetical protein